MGKEKVDNGRDNYREMIFFLAADSNVLFCILMEQEKERKGTHLSP
jgi:hypothetical protein